MYLTYINVKGLTFTALITVFLTKWKDTYISVFFNFLFLRTMVSNNDRKLFKVKAVAVPGFDLTEGVDFVNGQGGRNSLEVLTVEI